MGLDMYLDKCDRRAYGFKDLDISDVKKNNPSLYNTIKPYIKERGSYYRWESLFEEVGYWRKANAIHKWFVDNVQDGVDDCERYEVSKEQLKNLLDVCVKVVDASKCTEDGEYLINVEIAEKLLPTQGGFFFGSIEYDQWYIDDVVETIDILKKVINDTDFDREIITYTSSW